MSRRHIILEALGLHPLWVRRSLLAQHNDPHAAEQLTPEPVAAAPATSAPARAAEIMQEAIPTAARPKPPLVQPVPVVSTAPTDRARLNEIAAMDWPTLITAVRDCRACGLCQGRIQTVFAAGQPDADLLVVGEAPGAEEDRQGQPFVGPAGQLLDAMLSRIGHERARNVCIANALKCRPPQNRNPQPEEMALCTPFLHRQIELIAPKVILAVGKFAVQALLDRSDPIRQLRGQPLTYRGIPVVVSYHPAYLLRNPPDKAKAWEDLLRIKRVLQKSGEQP